MNQQPLHIVVLIDALGWTYIEGRDFLQDQLTYRVPVQTVLGFSSGAIPSILTGLPPSENGHWNLFYLDEKNSPFRWLRHFSFLPDFIFNHRVTSKILKEMGRHMLGLGPTFECHVSPRLLHRFNWVEKRSIYQRGGITGAPSIFDQLAAADVPYRVYSYHSLTDDQILRKAEEDLKAGEARFFFLYLSEMDAFLHQHCNEREKVDRKLEWYGEKLRNLFDLARSLDPDVSLTLISDHGMTPVSNHYDLAADIARLGYQMPDDYLAVYDSTMARFWFYSDAAKRRIVDTLKSLWCGRILPDEELRRLGIRFEDQRYGEVIFLLNPGWLIAESDFNGHGWMPLGMHGYHPDDAYSDGVFLSNRAPQKTPRSVKDVYSRMREALA